MLIRTKRHRHPHYDGRSHSLMSVTQPQCAPCGLVGGHQCGSQRPAFEPPGGLLLVRNTSDLGGFLERDPFLGRLPLDGITHARQRGATSGMMPADGIDGSRSRSALPCRDSAQHVTPLRCLPGD